MYNIGFYSSSPQHGKSTASNYLVSNYGYNILTFALTMKDMLEVLLLKYNYSKTTIHRMLYGDLKAEIIPELEVTPRHLLVSLGSGWGREMVKESMWVDLATRETKENHKYVCEDVRLENEANTLRGAGFKIIRIINPRIPNVDSISEGKLDDYKFDGILMNDKTIPELYVGIDNLLESFKGG